MKISTAWSMLAFSLGIACYVLNRDISANVFMGSFLIIQGLKRADGSRQERLSTFLAWAMSAGVLVFALCMMAGDISQYAPASFRYRG